MSSAEITTWITTTYRGKGWTALATVRTMAGAAGITREALDHALAAMAFDRGFDLEGEANQKAITAADRDAALRLGGRDRHALRVA